MVWKEGMAPSDWRNAVIVPVCKKGSRLDCTNYRGISLMSFVGKVFARIINERVKLVTADKMMNKQGGFRAGRGCNVKIFAVIHMAFVDLEKVYDNVSREKLWKVQDEHGVMTAKYRHCIWMDGQE